MRHPFIMQCERSSYWMLPQVGVQCESNSDLTSLKIVQCELGLNLDKMSFLQDMFWYYKQNMRDSPLHSAPIPSTKRRGKTFAQGTSNLWIRTPNRKELWGRSRPSRGWKLREKKRKPPCSLLPRKLSENVTLPSSSIYFPVDKKGNSQKEHTSYSININMTFLYSLFFD